MRQFLCLCIMCVVLCAASCGGKNTSSLDIPEGGQKAAWFGNEEAMLNVMRGVCGQYALADPLEGPEKGFTVTYYGHFRLIAELVPLSPAAESQSRGEDDAESPPPAPRDGVYGVNVSFDKGLAKYEEVVDRVYADLVETFDRNFSRSGAY